MRCSSKGQFPIGIAILQYLKLQYLCMHLKDLRKKSWEFRPQVPFVYLLKNDLGEKT